VTRIDGSFFDRSGWGEGPPPADTAPQADTEGAVVRGGGATRSGPLARVPFRRGAVIREIGPGKKKLPEPSGLAYHEERGTLFAVGDRGHLVELTAEGEIIERKRLGKIDLEAVTVGPGGMIYAAAETIPPEILEIDPDTMKIKRRYEVKEKFEGKRVVARKKNRGLEGLVYVKEEDAFFALNQDKPPTIVKLDLTPDPDDKDDGKARISEVIRLEDTIIGKAGELSYDAQSGHFLVIDSDGIDGKRPALVEVSRGGDALASYPLPGKHPEGFVLDPQGRAFIAQDSGKLLRVDP
jgi:uncharacterized protein YjiK